MRLLRRKPEGGFKLILCDSDNPPPYAILSHTWTESEEVTYNDLMAGTDLNKAGYAKIHFCVEQAAKDGLDYSWVDTCCIDKSRSNELSTAINSMFRWYQRASKCYVYLSDVRVPGEVTDVQAFRVTWEYSFRRSRWFTRGWTLQELLAPAVVEFFSENGKQLGTKISLEQEIHEITRIPISAIRGQRLSDFSIEERMNWSAERRTTLKEDRVYCLLGIFGIFIPLIYGEGEEYATFRIREEIQRRSKENLQGIETTAHLGRISPIHPSQAPHLIAPSVSQGVQPTLATTSRSIKSRYSLLRLDSLLRRLGFYGSYVSQRDAGKTDSQMLIRLGFCFFKLPGSLGFNALELLLSVTMWDKILKINWGFQAQYRVSAESPLMKACEKGDVALMRQILEEGKGGINDQITSSGKTPLMNGANPNVPDDDQILPVFAVAGMNLCRSQHFEQFPPTWDHWLDTLRLLIRYGASTHEIVRGRSLAGLNIARPDETSKVLPFLRLLAVEDSLDHNSIADDPSWPVVKSAVESGTDAVDALKLLHACGVSITRVLADGRTALHLAAHYCQDDKALSYLLETGCAADINRQDQWGWTPLHYAVLERTSAIGPRQYSKAIMLIRNGADPSIKGRMNPGSSYHFYSEEFTGFELLEYVRYPRFELLMNALNDSGIEVGSSANTDAFYDAEEYHSGCE